MKKTILFAAMAVLCSCESKNQVYADKYDKILKDEDLFIDSIASLPYIGVTTMDRLSSYTQNLDSAFNMLTKEHTADEYQPTREQNERHLKLIKRTIFYIEATDKTKK